MLTKRQVRAAIAAETNACHTCNNLEANISQTQNLRGEIVRVKRDQGAKIRTQYGLIDEWVTTLTDQEADLFTQALEHLTNDEHIGGE